MSTESDNVSILRRAYDTWAGEKAADMGCWACVFADDVRLTSLGERARPTGVHPRQARQSRRSSTISRVLPTTGR